LWGDNKDCVVGGKFAFIAEPLRIDGGVELALPDPDTEVVLGLEVATTEANDMCRLEKAMLNVTDKSGEFLSREMCGG
jgi:hypothetical protein